MHAMVSEHVFIIFAAGTNGFWPVMIFGDSSVSGMDVGGIELDGIELDGIELEGSGVGSSNENSIGGNEVGGSCEGNSSAITLSMSSVALFPSLVLGGVRGLFGSKAE
jgi:hypothetical protein